MSSSGAKSAVGTVVAMGVVGGGAVWLAQALAIVALGAFFFIGVGIISAGYLVYCIGRAVMNDEYVGIFALIGCVVGGALSFWLCRSIFGDAIGSFLNEDHDPLLTIFGIIYGSGSVIGTLFAIGNLVVAFDEDRDINALIAVLMACWAGAALGGIVAAG